MTYNVENLFDTEDDPGKNDETFLPLSKKQSAAHKQKCAKISRKVWRNQCLNQNWSEPVLSAKLERLARVILGTYQAKGPDILFLQEVENKNVLDRLNSNYLKKAGYQTVILKEGKDARGIDVAVLSRFPLVGQPKLHEIVFRNIEKKRKGDTRPILQVDLRLPSKEIASVFSVHFPAPFHPLAMREQAFHALDVAAKTASQKSQLIIAAGDFNVIPEESSRLYRVQASQNWTVAHLAGCFDCLGTNYYPPKNSWSFLDSILLYKSSQPFELAKESVTIVNDLPGQVNDKGQPVSFSMKKDGAPAKGFSDHLPMFAKIVRR